MTTLNYVGGPFTPSTNLCVVCRLGPLLIISTIYFIFYFLNVKVEVVAKE